MNKRELIKDIKDTTGKSFLKKADVERYLQMRKGTAAKILKDYPHVGSGQPQWFVNDVADAILGMRRL